jgi:hypothetical protein
VFLATAVATVREMRRAKRMMTVKSDGDCDDADDADVPRIVERRKNEVNALLTHRRE